MRKFVKSKKCVSEIVGVILMLGMAIALFTGVYIVAMDVIPFNPHSPSVRISGVLKDDTILIIHNGGEPLSLNTKIIFLYNDNKTFIENTTINKIINTTTNAKNHNYWDIGEELTYQNSHFLNKKIQFIMVDVDSNSIIAQDVFQEVK